MSTGDAGPGTATQQGAGEQGANGGEAQQGPDLGQLASSLEAMQAGQEELRQFLLNEPWKPQDQQETVQEPDPLDLSFLDPDSGMYDPAQLADKLGSVIEQAAEQRADRLVQQHIQPMQQQLAEERIAREAQMLVDEFPEMGDPEVGPQVVQFARQLAEHNSHPELGNEPWFWRTVFLAGRAQQAAAEAGEDVPQPAHLEGGSGARPGAQQVDMAEQIIPSDGVRRGRSALPFG